jgi:hypothetical protein
MIGIACSLCVLGALILTFIVQKLAELGSITAFLISWLAVMFIAGGLKLKEKSSQRGTTVFKFTKFLGFVCALIALYPGVKAFPQAWREGSGFGPKALLIWLVLLAWMLIWVIVQAAEEKGGSTPPTTPNLT